jgi:hypothetical protein
VGLNARVLGPSTRISPADAASIGRLVVYNLAV